MLFSVSLIAGCNSGQDGDAATWTVIDGAITSETQQFEALVTRLECAGGVTGNVLEPDISLGSDSVTIEFAVEPIDDGPQLCPGNNPVAVNVDLGEPIGDRSLVDGQCSSEAASTSFCADGGLRWSPAPPPPDCNGPETPERDLDMELVPAPPATSEPDGREEFGAEVIEALNPMILGADAGRVVATLRGSGWTVTVVERPVTTTTATPDLLWNRLVVTTCGGRVEAVAFD